MTAPTPSSVWCEYALIGGTVERDVSITIEDGRFTGVVPSTAPSPGTTRLPGITLPGFANAHSHAFHRALRSRVQAERGSFWTWRDVMYTAAQRLEPASYYRLARAVFAEMVLAGTSVVGEFHYLHHQANGSAYGEPSAMSYALLTAAEEAGIRITLLEALYLHGGLRADGYAPPNETQRRFTDGSATSWLARTERIQPNDGQRIGAAIHSVRSVDPNSMKPIVDWARQQSAPIHAHVSEQRAENEQCQAFHGCTPVELFESVGALDNNFTAVHATHLTDHDIDLLGHCQCTVCMCPTTERDLGDGIGPTADLTSGGVALSLGSDSHAVIDQMAEARAVELNERLRSEQRGIHSAAELLDMATTTGHASLGWDDAGAIEIGNRADLTTVSLSSERTAGANHDTLCETVVFASTASDISSVIVDGAQVVSDGQHHSIDVASELTQSIEELLP